MGFGGRGKVLPVITWESTASAITFLKTENVSWGKVLPVEFLFEDRKRLTGGKYCLWNDDDELMLNVLRCHLTY